MWYSKVTNNLAEIPGFITHYEHELEIAKSECRVGGLVEKNIKALPGLTEHRFNQLQEILINFFLTNFYEIYYFRLRKLYGGTTTRWLFWKLQSKK